MAGSSGVLGLLGAGAGGALVGGAVVRLFLDDAQFNAALGKSQAEFRAAGADMSATSTKFATIAKAAYFVAAVAVVKFADDAVKAAMAHQAAIAQLSAAAGVNTQAFIQLAQATESLTGFTQDQTIAAETQLARLHLTADQMAQLIPLVQDYARATGVDLVTSAGNIERAFLGNARALKAVGINFKATGVLATDLSTIMGDLATHVGGAAAAFSQTMAGKLAIMGAQFKDLEIQVGTALLPALEAIIPVITKVIRVVDEAKGPLGVMLAGFVAYKALIFLPGLLLSIAKAMGAVDIAAGAGVATLLSGIAEGIAGIAAENPALVATALSEFGQSVSGVTASTTDLANSQGFKSAGDVLRQMYTNLSLTTLNSNTAKMAINTLGVEIDTLVNKGYDLSLVTQRVNQDLIDSGANLTLTTADVKNLSLGNAQGAVVAGRLSDALKAAGVATANMQTHVNSAGVTVRNFAHMTSADLAKFQSDTKSSLDSTLSTFSGFTKKWAFSSKTFLNTMDQMATKSKTIAHDMKALNTEAIPQQFTAWLITTGPDAVHRFVDGSAAYQKQAVSDWKTFAGTSTTTVDGMIKKITGGITSLPPLQIATDMSQFNNAKAAIDQFVQQQHIATVTIQTVHKGG